MARPVLPEMSPWRRRSLRVPPDSMRDWVGLAAWESWMGLLLCGALYFGTRLIVTAPENIVTVFDYVNCNAAPADDRPCERVAFYSGHLAVLMNAWCGVLLIAVAVWLLWELWSAVAPQPITDDFLKLLDDSFGRSWRRPRSWPWSRLGWAYGFTFAGALSGFCLGWLLSNAISPMPRTHVPAIRVETSERFKAAP
jgi:hypothetical protein